MIVYFFLINNEHVTVYLLINSFNNPVSQSCAVAKSEKSWRATGQSNFADRIEDCSIGHSAVIWVRSPDLGKLLLCSQPFARNVKCTFNYCTWLWNWLVGVVFIFFILKVLCLIWLIPASHPNDTRNNGMTKHKKIKNTPPGIVMHHSFLYFSSDFAHWAQKVNSEPSFFIEEISHWIEHALYYFLIYTNWAANIIGQGLVFRS